MHAPAKIGCVLLLWVLQGHVLGNCSPEFNDGGPECAEAAETFCPVNKNATDCWLVATPDYTWENETYRVNCSGHPPYGNEPAWQAFGRVTSYALDGSEAYGAGTALNFIMFPGKVTRLSMRRYCLATLESATYRAFVFLARLELKDSRVGVVQQNAFEGLSALTELQLIGNEFGAGMHPDSLRWLGDQLQQLDVRGCAGVNFRLGQLKALTLAHLVDSEVVDLIEMIHPVPESLLQLTVINVRSELTPSLFLGTAAGKRFGPAGERFATAGLNLRHVVVVGSSLRYVHAANMPSLKLLNISGNGMVDGSISMRNLPALERLFATHNKLTKITANMLNVGRSLGFVDLSDNRIVYISGCAFGPNHRIIRLVLSGNPLIVADPRFRLPDAPIRCRDHRDPEEDKKDQHRPEAVLDTTTAASANFSSGSMLSIFDGWTVQEESPTFARAGKARGTSSDSGGDGGDGGDDGGGGSILWSVNSAVQGFTFLKDHEFQTSNIHFDRMSLTPSPTAILNTLCKEFLHANVTAILYMMNYESYGRSTASAQYFLQLAGYLGIPVISWNADNSGLERRASQSALQLQLAPSIEHQSAAMLSILERYKWQ